MSRSKSSNFIVQGGILAISSIIVRLIGILYRIPLTNAIGDEGIGYYSQAAEIYNIALILSTYGFPLAVSKLIVARSVKREFRNSFRVFKASILFSVVLGILSTSIVFFGADFFAQRICHSAYVAYPLKVLAPALFVYSVMGVLRGFYQGKNTMIPTSVSQIVEQIMNAVVSVVAAYMLMRAHDASDAVSAYGAAGGTLGTVMGGVASMVFLVLIFFMYYPTMKKQMRKDTTSYVESYTEIWKIILLTIVPVALSQLVYNCTGLIDNTIFSNLMQAKGATEQAVTVSIGIYSGKYKVLTNVPIALAAALGSSMIPSLVSSRTRGATQEVIHKISLATKSNMLLTIPCAVGLSVLADPIIDMLFPGSTAMAGNLLRYGSICVIFYALSTLSNAVLQGINRMRVPVTNSAISLVIHIVLIVVLLKFTDIGLYALVIGNISFPLVITIMNWYAIRKELLYKQEILKTFIIPFICSCFMGVVVLFSYKLLYMIVPMNFIATMGSIGIGAVAYFVFLIVFRGITKDELYKLPKGILIVKIASKLHLVK